MCWRGKAFGKTDADARGDLLISAGEPVAVAIRAAPWKRSVGCRAGPVFFFGDPWLGRALR